MHGGALQGQRALCALWPRAASCGSDPALGIDWPIDAAEATLNARDLAWPTLAQWVADGGSA